MERMPATDSRSARLVISTNLYGGEQMLKKKWMWILAVVAIATLVLAACQPKTVVVEKKVVETQIVEVEREVTKIVEGETKVETIVETKVVEVEKEVVVTATPAPSDKPVTLNWNLGTEPPQVDPALSTDTTSVQVDEMLFLGLTDFDDATNEVIPELATEWSASEDGLVWTFKMRDDVPWVRYNPATGETTVMTDEEGNPDMVDAHEVEYAVKRTLDPATGSDYAYVLYIIEGAMAFNSGDETDPETVGVKAVDDTTVEFTLRQPAGYFPGIASMWVARPVYKPAIDEYGARWVEPGIIVTNGPYVMDSWQHFDSMVLVKNPEFYAADTVQIERIELTMIVEASTAFAMYENNELDVALPPLEEMDRVKSDPVLSEELYIAPVLCTYYYGFTNNKPPFDDVLVRKAFSAAIDRVSLIENVTKGGQLPANTFAPAGIFGNAAGDPDIAPWALDPEMGKEMAKQWLAEAGYPDGEGFPVVSLMHNTSEGHRAIAEAIQAMWRDTLGVEVEVTNQEWGVYLETINKDTPLADEPHIWRLGWCADYADNNNWLHEVFNNQEGSNDLRRGCLDDTCTQVEELEFDRLTQAAGAEQDPAKRKELYRQAEKELSEVEAAYAPIYYYTTVVVNKPWLTRTYQALGGQHWDKWSIDWAAKQAATK
jgi:oligopeptide transport system substrate-binding protein